MFVWLSSNGSGPRIGCCGGMFFLPLAFFMLFGGFGGDNAWLLFVAFGVIAMLFLLPQFANATANTGKRKNDEYYDEYAGKPKRGEERYVLTDDGEIIEANDEDTRQYREDDRGF